RVTDLRGRDAEVGVRAVGVAGERLLDEESRAQHVDRRIVRVVPEDVLALVGRRGGRRVVDRDAALAAVDVGVLAEGRGRRGQGDRSALARIQVAEVAGQDTGGDLAGGAVLAPVEAGRQRVGQRDIAGDAITDVRRGDREDQILAGRDLLVWSRLDD